MDDSDLARLRKSSAEHVRRYLATDGEDGSGEGNVEILLLTTTGRRSGKPRSTPLIFGRDGDRYVVVASVGGHRNHPHWYLNLCDNPEVQIQIKGERLSAVARTALGEERARLWKLMAAIFPHYDEYQSSTQRTIPIVILETGDKDGTP